VASHNAGHPPLGLHERFDYGAFRGSFNGLLQNFAANAAAVMIFDRSVTLIVTAVVFMGTWSAMRLASLPGFEQFANLIEKIPLIGRVFERFYRPDTYYRQDTAKMYEKAFNCAVNETIDQVTNPQDVRRSEPVDGSPVVADVDRR
jgi:hypothetical protein